VERRADGGREGGGGAVSERASETARGRERMHECRIVNTDLWCCEYSLGSIHFSNF
jgi:hypothetical protein